VQIQILRRDSSGTFARRRLNGNRPVPQTSVAIGSEKPRAFPAGLAIRLLVNGPRAARNFVKRHGGRKCKVQIDETYSRSRAGREGPRSRGILVRFLATAALAWALLSLPAAAQFGNNTGGISGKVVDAQGGVLPGVAVTIKGPGAPQTVYSDAQGDFRVINLAPGDYTVTLALQGFSSVNRENVSVALGRTTELTIPMSISSVAATVTVSGEVPLISTKKVETGAAITNDELKEIPTARTPGSSCSRFRAFRWTA
jgi:hypothetical protein